MNFQNTNPIHPNAYWLEEEMKNRTQPDYDSFDDYEDIDPTFDDFENDLPEGFSYDEDPFGNDEDMYEEYMSSIDGDGYVGEVNNIDDDLEDVRSYTTTSMSMSDMADYYGGSPAVLDGSSPYGYSHNISDLRSVSVPLVEFSNDNLWARPKRSRSRFVGSSFMPDRKNSYRERVNSEVLKYAAVNKENLEQFEKLMYSN